MNIPPPPPPSSYIPPPPPPPAPPFRSAPRAPLSRRTKRLIAASLGVVAVLGIVFGVWSNLSSHPSKNAILAFLSKQTMGGKVTFTSIDRIVQKPAGGRMHISLDASGVTALPLYDTVNTRAFFTDALHLNVSKMSEVHTALNGAAGKRILEIAGVARPTVDPMAAIILREVTPAGTPVKSHNNLYGIRGPSGWLFTLSGVENDPDVAGSSRQTFGSHSYLAADPADQAALRSIIEEQIAFATKIAGAREKYQAELEKIREERTERFLEKIQPGILFVGRATRRRDQTQTPISLEIVSLATTTRQVTAKLRNDGGWGDARNFQGDWRSDSESESFTLNLGTRANQSINGAGPFVDVQQNWNVSFVVGESGSLSGDTDEYTYQLTPVAAAEMPKVRAELAATHLAAVAATAEGSVYIGSAISKRNNVPERVLLRFLKQQDDGALLSCRLESLERTDWQRPLRGTLQTNRYRGGDQSIRLFMQGDDRARAADDKSVFGISWNLNLAFRIEGESLKGEDDAFTYRLTRASSADLEAICVSNAEKEARFFAYVKTGATYDGTVKDVRGFSSRVRLIIKHVEKRDGTLRATLESREQTGIFHEVSGKYELGDATLRLGSSGGGRFNPSGILKVPFFSYDRTFNFTLIVREDGIYGSCNEWTLEFPATAKVLPGLTASTPGVELAIDDSGYPSFPTEAGAYVLTGGKWALLPKNDCKVTTGVAGAIGGFLGALNSLSAKDKDWESRPDKLGSLTFSGTAPAPTVDRVGVVVVYIGTVIPASANIIQKYPWLKDQPDIEMALMHVAANGDRQADLFRVAPSIGGFRNQRVAATVETVKPGVIMHSCSAPLAPGSYAISVNAEGFELSVR